MVVVLIVWFHAEAWYAQGVVMPSNVAQLHIFQGDHHRRLIWSLSGGRLPARCAGKLCRSWKRQTLSRISGTAGGTTKQLQQHYMGDFIRIVASMAKTRDHLLLRLLFVWTFSARDASAAGDPCSAISEVCFKWLTWYHRLFALCCWRRQQRHKFSVAWRNYLFPYACSFAVVLGGIIGAHINMRIWFVFWIWADIYCNFYAALQIIEDGTITSITMVPVPVTLFWPYLMVRRLSSKYYANISLRRFLIWHCCPSGKSFWCLLGADWLDLFMCAAGNTWASVGIPLEIWHCAGVDYYLDIARTAWLWWGSSLKNFVCCGWTQIWP